MKKRFVASVENYFEASVTKYFGTFVKNYFVASVLNYFRASVKKHNPKLMPLKKTYQKYYPVPNL